MLRTIFASLCLLAASAPAQADKATDIILALGFDTGMAPLIQRVLPTTETHRMIMVACPILGPGLRAKAIERAMLTHHGDWAALMGAHLTASFGEDFVAAANLNDPQTLDTTIRAHPQFDPFLNGLEPRLRPILVDAVATTLAAMLETCPLDQ